MLSMKDKVAIVTGAGSVGPGWGNGKATATLLARQGASVFLVDINRGCRERDPPDHRGRGRHLRGASLRHAGGGRRCRRWCRPASIASSVSTSW